MTTPEAQDEPLAWIGRERSFERVPEWTVEKHPEVAPAQAVAGRWKWTTVGAVIAALLIAFAAWKLLSGGAAKPASTLADRGGVPLVSVLVPRRQAVTSNVTFTGAIAARYDMPIANDGDTGRIVAVYVGGRRPRQTRPAARQDR